MTDKKLKFAIIGAGSVATFHADAIQSIENAQLAGVFDQNSEMGMLFKLYLGI